MKWRDRERDGGWENRQGQGLINNRRREGWMRWKSMQTEGGIDGEKLGGMDCWINKQTHMNDKHTESGGWMYCKKMKLQSYSSNKRTVQITYICDFKNTIGLNCIAENLWPKQTALSLLTGN